MLRLIAYSAPFYDKGMLAAIKISEMHKEMVMKKFERYIVSYVLAGSLIQGKATSKSDIDVFIVVDDTDVMVSLIEIITVEPAGAGSDKIVKVLIWSGLGGSWAKAVPAIVDTKARATIKDNNLI